MHFSANRALFAKSTSFRPPCYFYSESLLYFATFEVLFAKTTYVAKFSDFSDFPLSE